MLSDIVILRHFRQTRWFPYAVHDQALISGFELEFYQYFDEFLKIF